MLCSGPLGGSVCVKSLLTRTLQFAEVAYRLHSPSQLTAGQRCLIDLRCIGQALLRRHSLHPGLAHLGDLVNYLGRQPQLLLLHQTLRHLGALG